MAFTSYYMIARMNVACLKEIYTSDDVTVSIVEVEGKELAFKSKTGNPSDFDQVENEQLCLMDCVHESIIKCIESGVVIGNREGFLMQYCRGGSLGDRLEENGRMSEAIVRNVARCVLRALSHVHEVGYVHFDIKPDNILICDDSDFDGTNVVIADFGLACRISEAVDWFAGTTGYQAPEVLREKDCGKEVDMWSLGVTVYELLMNKLPFGRVRVGEANCNLTYPSLDGLSYWCRSFLEDLFLTDPSERMTASEALEHEWLRE